MPTCYDFLYYIKNPLGIAKMMSNTGPLRPVSHITVKYALTH